MRGHEAVKGEGFDSWRSVGSVRNAVRVYQMRSVDELVLLDIAATREGKDPNFALVKALSGDCFMPLSVGGGITTVEQVVELLKCGADKIVLNTAAIENPDLIGEIATKVGRQSVVVSIDVKNNHVCSRSGTEETSLSPALWAAEVERRGAGEIILNSCPRDGTLEGFDLNLVRQLSAAVNIPVVACGGAGTYEHLKEGLEAGAHAVAASAMWYFTEATPAGAAEFLADRGIAVRRKIAA